MKKFALLCHCVGWGAAIAMDSVYLPEQAKQVAELLGEIERDYHRENTAEELFESEEGIYVAEVNFCFPPLLFLRCGVYIGE